MDANVLKVYDLRDILLWMVILSGLKLCTSAEVLDETFREHFGKEPRDPTLPLRSRELMERVLEPRDLLVQRPDTASSARWSLPHRADEAVLAATLEAGARVLLTFNLRHFPEEALLPAKVHAVHPDAWLCRLLDERPEEVLQALREAARLRRRDPRTPLDIGRKLSALGQLPTFSTRLLTLLDAA